MWLPQIKRLQDTYYCLAPDLPEHGQSLEVGPLSMDAYVDIIAALIRESVDSRAHVVGLSLGGSVAVTLLARYPELVDGIVISGTAQRLGKLYAWLNNLNAPILKYWPKDQLVSMMAKNFGIPPEMTGLVNDIRQLSPEAMLRVTDMLKDLDVPTSAPNPILVCVGEKETGVAKNMARQWVRMLRNARGVIAPGGHVWNLQYPALFAETVRAFLTDSPLPEALIALG
jgi:pimeloyl-ACP methyl ester carboxylesterase